MKIRIGFVSNSSSSSFLIYGTRLTKSKLKEVLVKKTGKPEEEFEDDIGYCAEKELGVDYYHPSEDDYWYFGVSWSKVGDDETGKQFKERVEKMLREAFGDDVSCGTHKEAWFS